MVRFLILPSSQVEDCASRFATHSPCRRSRPVVTLSVHDHTYVVRHLRFLQAHAHRQRSLRHEGLPQARVRRTRPAADKLPRAFTLNQSVKSSLGVCRSFACLLVI